MFCRQCGAQLQDDDKFCEACGNPVARKAASSERPGAAPGAPKQTSPGPWAGGSTGESLKPFTEDGIKAFLNLKVGKGTGNLPFVYCYSINIPWWHWVISAVTLILPPLGIAIIVGGVLYYFRAYVLAASGDKFVLVEATVFKTVKKVTVSESVAGKFVSFHGDKLMLRYVDGEQYSLKIPLRSAGLPNQQLNRERIFHILKGATPKMDDEDTFWIEDHKYVALRGQSGTAFCSGCRTVAPKSELFYCETIDTYRHRECDPS